MKAGIASLAELKARTQACRECPIGEFATQSVIGEGHPKARLMLVGDFNSDMSAYMLKGLARDYRLTALPALNGSWPSPLPGLLRLSIDNALAGADWRLSGRVVGPDIGSDHRPIAFTLQRN